METIIQSLVGGVFIGLSAAALLFFQGKIAGISSILGAVLSPAGRVGEWRWLFLVGLVAGGFLTFVFRPGAFTFEINRSVTAVIVAGLLVGFGARLGQGCTSGHGVCGVGRLSLRSIVATVIFIATGAVTVFIINHLFGGVL
ncbi:MAG: YeeE/YedE family protein [Blastocatellia bacterium]|nr:YeeE/YedE family protein [Blastocatellia bacterium]